MKFFNKTIFAMLVAGLLLTISACNEGPDPAEQMAEQFNRQNPPSSAADTTESEAPAEDSGEMAAGENPCGDAMADEGEADNPCAGAEGADEAAEENPCAEADGGDDAAAENPCAEADGGDEAEGENPCAEGEGADEAAEENPCAEAGDESMEEDADEAPAIEEMGMEEPLTEEESADDTPQDPVEAFMELDPRDILRAKQADLESRLTSPWDEDNPDGFIPETGRVDPLTLVNSAIPDELKPPRSGSTDQNEIEVYLATIFATETVEQVSRALQCYSVIEIGVVSTAYFAIGDQRFAMNEGSSINIGGANVSCTGVSDTKVTVNISVAVPGNVVSRTKTYIPRSL